MAADRCIVTAEMYGNRYWLRREMRLDGHGVERPEYEWVLEPELRSELSEDEARSVAALYGGSVTKLDQRRTVDGQIVRSTRGRA